MKLEMANLNFDKYIIKNIRKVDIIDIKTGEKIGYFDITPFENDPNSEILWQLTEFDKFDKLEN